MPLKHSPRRPRQRWSAQERAAHLAACRSSRMSVRRYCESYGVPLSTLDFWRRQEKRRSSPAFARVELMGPSTVPALAVTLRRRDGVEIQVTGLDQAGLITALRAVLS